MFEQRGHLPRRDEDEIQIDWLLIFLGPWDPAKGARAGGLLDDMAQVTSYIALSRRIDSWLIRGIAILAIVKWIGLDHAVDIMKIFGGHAV